LIRSKSHKDIHFADRFFAGTLQAIAWGVPLLLVFIAIFLTWKSLPTIRLFGFSFLTSQTWDPVQDQFGALPVVYGTLVSSFLAVLLAAPISIGVALFLTELAPSWLARPVGFLVEMLAAIPSVVYGLWGIFVLAPLLRTTVQPALAKSLGHFPLFEGPPLGVGMMAAGVILAIMIIPTIATLSREVFLAIPAIQRENALALGATRWEMMQIAVLKTARSGILGAIILGLGRALGETMAVTMLIGNRAEISASLLAPGQTMSSLLANEYAEASGELHLSALLEVGLLLFLVTFIINALARLFVWRSTLGKSPR